ncbi:MAG: PAS-domain containing protein, partial [Pseudomonadota bacterium]
MMALAATGWVGVESAALDLAERVAASGASGDALPYVFAGLSGAVAVAAGLTARSLHRRMKAAEAQADRLAWKLDHDLSTELAFIIKPGRLLPASPATMAFLETAAAAQARRDGEAAPRAELAALLGPGIAGTLQEPITRLLNDGARFRLEASDERGAHWFILGETVGARAVLRLTPSFEAAAAKASDAAAAQPSAGEAELQAMIDAAPAGVVAFDAEKRLRIANEAALRLLRLPPSFTAGSPNLRAFLDQLHRRQRMPEQANYSAWRDRVLADPAALNETNLWALPNGEALRVWAARTPAGGVALFLSDETAALQSERRFRIAEGARRATIAAVEQGLALIGGEGSVQLLNPAFARIWALDATWCADSEARRGPDGAGDGGRRLGLDQLAAAASRGGALDREIWAQIETALRFEPPRRIHRFTGRRLLAPEREGDAPREQHLALQVTPLPDGASLISCVDVSAAHAAEQALRERAEALEAADRLKTDFLTDMAYQLRTPLNAVIGFSDMLNQGLAGPLQERQRAYVGYVLSAADDLRELISDALDLGALRAGSLTLRRGAFDLAATAGAVASMAQRRAERRRAAFHADLAARDMPMFGDERRLRHALFSAISAALNDAEAGDKARLSLGQEGSDRAVIEVALERSRRRTGAGSGSGAGDAGAEDSAAEDSGAEDAGASGSAATTADDALDGVSLSLARKIIEAHGGATAAARSEDGFWIRFDLPLDPEARAEDAALEREGLNPAERAAASTGAAAAARRMAGGARAAR